MLELPLLQASGCFVSAAVTMFALSWTSASCQGLHTASPPTVSLGPSSTGRSCRPFRDWAWPCLPSNLGCACVAQDVATISDGGLALTLSATNALVVAALDAASQ
jgi:hypothetical protein